MTTTSTRKPRTPSTRTTTAKATAAPAKAAERLTEAAAPVVTQPEPPSVALPEMKKKDLVDAVVARSGVKKRDAKPAVEAALAILGDALSEGRDLNLAPMGKVMVKKQKKISQGSVLTLRLRQNDKATNDGPDPLAQAAE
ncbi:HU family DNA-binding protein [Thalassococcus profundi]|nr:HU family DNA-binding protein [Thalassococcus profundi]